jgi:hypothetical protein
MRLGTGASDYEQHEKIGIDEDGTHSASAFDRLFIEITCPDESMVTTL